MAIPEQFQIKLYFYADINRLGIISQQTPEN